MLNNIHKHMEYISKEQVVNLGDFQEINIVSNKETITKIKKMAKESGLPVSRVIEAIIRAGLDDLQVVAG
jgi:predicted DNA binding CopG/RHH family protein